MSSEDFWRKCFHLLPVERKVEILFDFPYRGTDGQWFPTWAQVLDWPKRNPEYDHMRSKSSPDIMRNKRHSLLAISGQSLMPFSMKRTTLVNTNLMDCSIFMYPTLSQQPIDITRSAYIYTCRHWILDFAYNWVVCKAIEKRAWHRY